MNPIIYLKNIEIDTISINSGIFRGENNLNYYEGRSDENEGFGKVEGESNTIMKTKNTLIKHEPN